jgi:uncharacterized protein YjbI with pentapeptide repeats
MANQEHLDILSHSVENWNQWRKLNPEKQPDLSGADLRWTNINKANLSGTDLNNADLSTTDAEVADNQVRYHIFTKDPSKVDFREAYLLHANLRWANFSGSNFENAQLDYADLSWADLSRTRLVGASLSQTNLFNTNLNSADLKEAYLDGADLNWTNLDDADLSEATLNITRFGNIDLRPVNGLERVIHSGPSTIGIDCIYLSEGNIPEAFLKGAGVDDTFITYIRSLVGKPIEYYSCFISYSNKDQAFAERLYVDLQAKGVRCWLDKEDLKIGEKFRPRIDEAIRRHDKLLLVLSQHSLRSPWVEKEVETAFEKERIRKKLVLFPIKLDETVTRTKQAWAADIRKQRHIGDFTRWKEYDEFQNAFTRLLRDLKAEDSHRL